MDAPRVLYRSNRWLVVRACAGPAVVGVLALRFSFPVIWSIAPAAGYAALVFALVPRALVVDDGGIATVPLLPFLPCRRVRWADVRALTWGSAGNASYVVVKRTNGRHARRFVALYSLERGGPTIRGPALCALLQERWDGATPAPELAERRARVAREARRTLRMWSIGFALIALTLLALVLTELTAGGTASSANLVEIVALALPAAGAASLAILLLTRDRRARNRLVATSPSHLRRAWVEPGIGLDDLGEH